MAMVELRNFDVYIIMTTSVTLRLLDTGYCLVSERHMLRGGAKTTLECHALVGLIEHPTEGFILFDTGYAPRMLAATASLPYALYRAATPLRLDPALALVAQLPRLGIALEDVTTVVISHFHADHIAGLHDFPVARLIATQEGYAAVAELRGLAALRRAFLPSLMPRDFAARATLLSDFSGPALPALGPTHDVFGDGMLRLVRLPGHACGQIGTLVQTERGPVLLAADGAWHSRAVREQRPPAAVTRFVVDDWHAVDDTIRRLHAFSQACPDVAILPTHCPEVYRDWVIPG